MKGYFGHIEDETRKNTDYRRVLYTARHSQLVAMRLKPGEEIGTEAHTVDQFFRFESGEGKVIVDGTDHVIGDGDAVIVPAGSTHNVINTSADTPLDRKVTYVKESLWRPCSKIRNIKMRMGFKRIRGRNPF
ncbi:cupin domain-containing protein [Candidatus Azambacteria bacterium]|nr:cupin domain-containing protein [Candidatus Azambacteria bacterium]MBI3684848.1 cupin domain-containing protein [Candidatus Azambacteria bacterium]